MTTRSSLYPSLESLRLGNLDPYKPAKLPPPPPRVVQSPPLKMYKDIFFYAQVTQVRLPSVTKRLSGMESAWRRFRPFMGSGLEYTSYFRIPSLGNTLSVVWGYVNHSAFLYHYAKSYYTCWEVLSLQFNFKMVTV